MSSNDVLTHYGVKGMKWDKPKVQQEEPQSKPKRTIGNPKLDALVRGVLAGKFGTGAARKKALGKDADRVQDAVNEKLLGKTAAARIKKARLKAVAKGVTLGDIKSGKAHKKGRALGKAAASKAKKTKKSKVSRNSPEAIKKRQDRQAAVAARKKAVAERKAANAKKQQARKAQVEAKKRAQYKKDLAYMNRKQKAILDGREFMHTDALAKDAYLEHFGVKGMKWGVRKDRSERKPRVQRRAERDAERVAVAEAYRGPKAMKMRRKVKASMSYKLNNKKYRAAYKTARKNLDRDAINQKAAAKTESAKRRLARKKGVVEFVARHPTAYAFGTAPLLAYAVDPSVRKVVNSSAKVGMKAVKAYLNRPKVYKYNGGVVENLYPWQY